MRRHPVHQQHHRCQMFKCSTRVNFVCTHFLFHKDPNQRQLSPALEVSTSQVLFSLEKKQMQMQIFSQETWSVSPGSTMSTAHPLTSKVIIFKHCNCLCSVHLKDDLKRNHQNSTQKFKILENFNFLKTESRSKWKNSAFLHEGSQSKPAVL